jgi:hypothetical protein
VAICGYSICLPGVNSTADFVEVLRAKALCRSDVIKAGLFHPSMLDPDDSDPWKLRSRWHNLFTQEEGE